MEEYPVMTCPECGVVEEDLDGFGMMICTACGYCCHPSITGGACDGCGEDVPYHERYSEDDYREDR